MRGEPDWKFLALILGSTIAGFGFMGVLAVPVHGNSGAWLRWFDLDRELNFPMLFSAFLLVACGWLTWELVRSGQMRRAILSLAIFFVFMAGDEMLKVHESLEKWTGIDWQILYLPIVLVAGVSWAWIWWNSRGLTRFLWTAGAFCWVASQGLEAFQWGGIGGDEKIAGYAVLMVAEELLEMSGSSLFLLALFRLRWPRGWGPEAAAGAPQSR